MLSNELSDPGKTDLEYKNFLEGENKLMMNFGTFGGNASRQLNFSQKSVQANKDLV